MTRHCTIGLLLLATTLPSWSQRIMVGAEVHLGTYSMESMKSVQSSSISGLGLPFETVSSFPAYPGFKLQGSYAINSTAAVGTYFGFNSTGGRLYLEDYSGSVTQDILCQGVSAGVFGEYKLHQFGKYELKGTFSIGAIFGKAEFRQSMQFTGTSLIETSRSYSATNITFSPGITLYRILSPRLAAWGQLSYLVDIPGQLAADSGTTPPNPPTMQWSGARLGLGLGYVIR